jgi:two-component system, chemotaxis family, chemotaxis protein CheY
MANPKRILVVDDEPNLLDMLVEFCDNIGVTAIPAVNGAEALQKAAAEKPDAITVDMRMPDMTGLDVISRIKSDPATRAIPIFLCTADGKLHETEAKSRGATGVIPKPVKMASLQQALETVLGPL